MSHLRDGYVEEVLAELRLRYTASRWLMHDVLLTEFKRTSGLLCRRPGDVELTAKTRLHRPVRTVSVSGRLLGQFFLLEY